MINPNNSRLYYNFNLKHKIIPTKISSNNSPYLINSLNQNTYLPSIRSRKLQSARKASVLELNNNKESYGRSCHQCKSLQPLSELTFCQKSKKNIIIGPSFRNKSCKKKYCKRCLNKFYPDLNFLIRGAWVCPSCQSKCTCANCRTRKENLFRKEKLINGNKLNCSEISSSNYLHNSLLNSNFMNNNSANNKILSRNTNLNNENKTSLRNALSTALFSKSDKNNNNLLKEQIFSTTCFQCNRKFDSQINYKKHLNDHQIANCSVPPEPYDENTNILTHKSNRINKNDSLINRAVSLLSHHSNLVFSMNNNSEKLTTKQPNAVINDKYNIIKPKNIIDLSLNDSNKTNNKRANGEINGKVKNKELNDFVLPYSKCIKSNINSVRTRRMACDNGVKKHIKGNIRFICSKLENECVLIPKKQIQSVCYLDETNVPILPIGPISNDNCDRFCPDITVLNLGSIDTRLGYSTKKHIYPVNFKSYVLWRSIQNPNSKVYYTNEIISTKCLGPLFRVTCSESGIVYESYSCFLVWKLVFDRIKERLENDDFKDLLTVKDIENEFISGEEMFGLSIFIIRKLIQELPKSKELKTQFIDFENGLSFPMSKYNIIDSNVNKLNGEIRKRRKIKPSHYKEYEIMDTCSDSDNVEIENRN